METIYRAYPIDISLDVWGFMLSRMLLILSGIRKRGSRGDEQIAVAEEFIPT